MACKGRVTGFCYVSVLMTVGATLLLSGCKKGQGREVPPPPTVEVVEVIRKDVPVFSEWIASTDGFVNATIRAQVQGYLIKQNYREGDLVKKGQILFEIDPRPFEAVMEQAKGQLAQQQARWETAKANLGRIKPLAEQKAVSMKDLDDATGTEQATRAGVIAAQAVVDKAQVDLGFTKITSPIDGISGIAKAQIGNLVGPGSIEELTTVSTVDPIKVYIPMSEQEYLRDAQRSRGRTQQVPLDLILADGSIHPHKGALAFADRQVDIRTGTIKIAALFPNPGNILRPGQFARIRAQSKIKKGALLVPQRAVTELQGSYQVAVVGSDNKVDIRPVKVTERVDNLWVIDEGLKPSEKVIVEGVQKVKQDMAVNPMPYGAQPQAKIEAPSTPNAKPSAQAKTKKR
ncbi:MAG: efflux RND transporter periplasmic adaptor subunit [Thermodesulfobacteriota bacterium]